MCDFKSLILFVLSSAVFVLNGCERPVNVVRRVPLTVVHSRPLMNGWTMLIDSNETLEKSSYESIMFRSSFALRIGGEVHWFTEKSDGLYSEQGGRTLPFELNAVLPFSSFPRYPSIQLDSVSLIDIDTMQCVENGCKMFTYSDVNVESGSNEIIVYVESIGIVAMIGRFKSLVMLAEGEELSEYLSVWIRLHGRDPVVRGLLGYYLWE